MPQHDNENDLSVECRLSRHSQWTSALALLILCTWSINRYACRTSRTHKIYTYVYLFAYNWKSILPFCRCHCHHTVTSHPSQRCHRFAFHSFFALSAILWTITRDRKSMEYQHQNAKQKPSHCTLYSVQSVHRWRLDVDAYIVTMSMWWYEVETVFEICR